MNETNLKEKIVEILQIKNKVSSNLSIRDLIFERHNIIKYQNNEFSFKKEKKIFNKIMAFLSLSFFIGSIISAFYDNLFLAFSFGISILLFLLSSILYSIFTNNDSLILEHEDYVDLSKILSQDELKSLISFYKEYGVKAMYIGDDEYHFNLCDLYEPFTAEYSVKPEILKEVKQYKFDEYMQSLYQKN